MANKFDSFVQKLHKMCKKDDVVMNQLIAGTISWADVPSDDDILELEGWRAYAEVHRRAKSAYHHTVRGQKRALQRTTVKHVQPKPMGRKPYLIMKQEQTKNILSNGRITPIREIVDVVVQEPAEYEEADIEFITMPTPVEVQVKKPIEVQVETPVEEEQEVENPVEEESPIISSITMPKTQSQLRKRPSKEKFNKKKQASSPILYQPSFVQLYIKPILPYIGALFLALMIMTMHL